MKSVNQASSSLASASVAWRCRGFVAASTVTRFSHHAVILFGIASRYADVMLARAAIERLRALSYDYTQDQ